MVSPVRTLGARAARLFADQGLGLGKRQGLPGIVFAQQGGGDPIRVVDSLQGGLAADAQPALVDGMQGVALELDDPAFAIFGQNAAAGRAFAASGGIPGRLAGHHVVGCVDQGKQVFLGF